MIKDSMRWFVVIFIFVISTAVYSVQQNDKEDKPVEEKTEFENAHWLFTGMVNDGNNQPYGYYFKIERQGQLFHVKAALMDGQKQQLIFFNWSFVLIL